MLSLFVGRYLHHFLTCCCAAAVVALCLLDLRRRGHVQGLSLCGVNGRKVSMRLT